MVLGKIDSNTVGMVPQAVFYGTWLFEKLMVILEMRILKQCLIGS